MKNYKVSLKETYGIEGGELECILLDLPFDRETPEWKRPAVIVVPGGGYHMVSKREGEPSFLLHIFYAIRRIFDSIIHPYSESSDRGGAVVLTHVNKKFFLL